MTIEQPTTKKRGAIVAPPEKLKEWGSKGGKARKGKLNQTTIDRMKILEDIRNVGAERAKRLLDTQTILAMGCIYVMRIDYERRGKYKVAKKPVIVSNPDEIVRAIDWEYGTREEDPNSDTKFYFIASKEPENMAINSILDRTFGRATENKTIVIEKGMGALLDEIEEEEDKK